MQAYEETRRESINAVVPVREMVEAGLNLLGPTATSPGQGGGGLRGGGVAPRASGTPFTDTQRRIK